MIEQVEELQEAIKGKDLELAKKLQAKEEEEKNLAEFIAGAEESIAQEEKILSELRPQVPPELLSLYEKLKKSLGELVVVELRDGVCTGCQMELPAEEIDRITGNPDKIWHCTHCRRILVQES